MLIRRGLASLKAQPRLVRICSGCGAWHSSTHSCACSSCGSALSPEAATKPARDFSELIALGDLQDARLFTCFEFAVTKYPWPVSERMHLVTVINGVSSLKQLRKSHLPTLAKMEKSSKDCAGKLGGSRESNKAHIGFFKHSPLRLTCMHYLLPPLKQDVVATTNWLPLSQVLNDLAEHDRVLKANLDVD
jgi:hypothetical protein